MSDTVEHFVTMRRRLLMGSLVGYSLWVGAMVIKGAVSLNTGALVILSAIESCGAIAWTVYSWRVVQMQQQLRQRQEVARRLEDEWVRANRMKAAGIGLVALMALHGLLTGILTLRPHLFSGLTVSQISILVGYVGFIGGYLYLDRKGE